MWGGKAALGTAEAGAGYVAGLGMGALGLAAGAGYVGYRALRGSGPAHVGPRFQLNRGIQTRMMGGVLGAGAAVGMHQRDPMLRADFSPGGNLEVKSPAMLDATGDLTLSLNRNARNVPAPTQYGYMTTTTIPGIGRY